MILYPECVFSDKAKRNQAKQKKRFVAFFGKIARLDDLQSKGHSWERATVGKQIRGVIGAILGLQTLWGR